MQSMTPNKVCVPSTGKALFALTYFSCTLPFIISIRKVSSSGKTDLEAVVLETVLGM